MQRPSILFFNRVYPPGRGATGRVLRDLARAFAKEGWHVTVVTTGEKAGRERDGAVHVVRVKGSARPGAIGYLWISFKMLFKGLRLPRRHIVVTMTDPPFLAVVGRSVARAKKCRHIHWCQDLFPDIFPALGFNLPVAVKDMLRRLSGQAMEASDRTIVIGRCMARQLSYYNIDPRRITVIPNWPDTELVQPANDGNSEAQELPLINGNGASDLIKEAPKFRVLYAGNIGKAHPVDTILQAAEILSHEHPEIEFMFVGDGPRFDYITKEREKRRLDNIRLIPFQPSNRLRTLMESGDVHLVSMKDEAAGCLVPSKLYSALAVGRPCIFVGPAQSEVAKVINDFKAGVVVPQGNAEQLADAIRHFRMNGDDWFSAHQAAGEAGHIFVPAESINAWIERAWDVAQNDEEFKQGLQEAGSKTGGAGG